MNLILCNTKQSSLNLVVIYNDKFHELETLYQLNNIYEPWHEIFNNIVCATSKASDQPAHTRSLIRAFTGRLNILRL